jgi:hypothetical protein
MHIAITTTAMRRPDILRTTLQSFVSNLFSPDDGIKYTLVLNIDPLGLDVKSMDVVRVAREFFPDTYARYPDVASFPNAFKWCWERAIELEPDYVFNLEDDWILNTKIQIRDLISILEDNPSLVSLRLPAFHSGQQSMKNWNRFFPYNGRYYDCPKDMIGGIGFAGHPSLLKTSFVRNVTLHLDTNRNPEKQFHQRGNSKIMVEVLKSKFGVYGIPGSPPMIRDIGRRWAVQNGWAKEGCKAHFQKWRKVE